LLETNFFLSNSLPPRFNILSNSVFLVKKMENITPFMIPENDPNSTRKKIAVEFLSLVGSGRPKEGLRFFSYDCKTHNPYVVGGMNELIDAMIAVQKQGSEGIIEGSKADFKLSIKHILADGNLVAVHTTVASSNPIEGGLRQVHIFRFTGDRIVEYWDITQDVHQNMPNAAEAFS
jgi:predicted SnoaL-like aldol condensation-catalyzing enzyme